MAEHSDGPDQGGAGAGRRAVRKLHRNPGLGSGGLTTPRGVPARQGIGSRPGSRRRVYGKKPG